MTKTAFKATEHPHIVRAPDIGGGSPSVAGTRILVRMLAEHHRSGVSVDEILQAYPHLRPAQVHDALSYYFDHRDEIDLEIDGQRLSTVMQRHDLRYLPDPAGAFGRLLTAAEFDALSDEEKRRTLTWDALPAGLGE